MKDDNTLEIRKVNIVAKTNDQVLVESGLQNGERLIVTGLSSPVAGSLVQLLEKDTVKAATDHTAADDSRATKGAITQ